MSLSRLCPQLAVLHWKASQLGRLLFPTRYMSGRAFVVPVKRVIAAECRCKRRLVETEVPVERRWR